MIEWPNEFFTTMPPGTDEFFSELQRLGWDEIGRGDEAICFRNLRQDDRKGEIVLRLNHSFNYKDGLQVFSRHQLLRQLDDHFRHLGLYVLEHIGRPQAPVNGGYYYDFMPGAEGFSWQTEPPEWREFVNAFASFGIMVGCNTCETTDYVAKNVVSDGNHFYRIDYGVGSLPIHKDRLFIFAQEHRLKISYFNDL